MRRFLIVTHGKMADGMAQSIEMVLGKRNDLTWLCAYVDGKSLSELIDPVIEAYDDSDEIVIFTDISHGSVTIPYPRISRLSTGAITKADSAAPNSTAISSDRGVAPT